MPIPEERLYKPDRLNRWFAVSSLLMTVSIVWMVWIDYDRPWRAFQDRYFVGKAALAHLDFLAATQQDRIQEIDRARQRLADAQSLVSQEHAPRIKELGAEAVRVDLSLSVKDGEWSRKGQLLEVTRDKYEKTLAQFGADDPATIEAHKTLTEGEEVVERLRKEVETFKDRKAKITDELDRLNAPVRLARKTLSSLEQVAASALRKDQSYRGVLADTGLVGGIPIVRGIINAPILDSAAPKTTPGHEVVKQLVLPDVRQQLNYLESYTTDRCTTCHVAIDDPQFSKDRLARKLERSLPAINEALQRMDLDPFDPPLPPVLKDSGQTLPAGRVTDFWQKLTRKQQDDYFETLLTLVNSYLKLSHRKTIDLRQPILAHPDLDLFVSVKSPHPMAKMGCTVCHEGNPQETDFVQAAHSPGTHKISERWKEEYYVRRLGVPNTTFERVEHYWDRAMLLPRFTEAGCAKCHQGISDIARFNGERIGRRINLGRHLFTSIGCVNCHNVDALPHQRRVGPDLRHVAAKLQPEFLQQWVFAPQTFRPSTRMPHFFLQENNRAQSATSLDPDPVLRTQTEVAAISQYLFSVSKAWRPIERPEGIVGDVQRGRRLFRTAGCLACHGNIAEFGQEWITRDLVAREGIDAQTARYRYLGMTYEQRVRYAMKHFSIEDDTFLDPQSVRFHPEDAYHKPTFTRFAPELSGVGSKVNADWLYSWLREPTHYAPDTKMPNLRLTPREAADLTAYLMTLKNKDFKQATFELNTARGRMVDDLLFMLLTAQRSQRRSRAIMADEGGELSDMLVTLLADSLGKEAARALIQPMKLESKKLMFLGNKMIAHYGCYTCHYVRGFEQTTPVGTDLSRWADKPVSQLDFAFYDHAFEDMRHEKEETFGYVYPTDADELNHWSPLDDRMREQISLTHAGFAKHKLLNPRIWDREKLKLPYDKLKMPNFYLSEREAEALTTYLLSRTEPRVNEVLTIDYEGDTRGAIARGRDLTRELNCIACHQIEDNAPTIQQYFRRTIAGRLEFDALNAPPLLWGEGAKVQHNWLHRFLQQVVPLRPWLEVRMPSFTLTGEQATTLAEYFAALSRSDHRWLAKTMAPINEYIQKQRAKAKQVAKKEAGSKKPGADWFRQDSLELPAAQLRRWAVERKLMRASELDLLHQPVDRLRAAHERLLTRTDFMQKLYDVQYPFVEPPRPFTSREQYERGSRFFKDMGCLQCHVLGNMLPGPAKNTDDFVQMYRLDDVRGEGEKAVAILNGKAYAVGSVMDGIKLVSAEKSYTETGDVDAKAVFEGPNEKGQTERILLVPPIAPNLSLTYQRLQRAWVMAWMLQPQWIQPGTKMPQNFPNGVSPFEGDPNYPGTGLDHINLLVDYLYEAGATNTRAVMQKIVVTAQEEEFNEDEGGDEEFDDD